MAQVQVVINQVGPLPITQTFTSEIDMEAMLFVSGSVWSNDANQMIGIEVLLDGEALGAAEIFSNGATTHRAVVPQYIPINLTIGDHTITLQASTGETVSDYNDFYRVLVHL
ncbi:MAG: hypothetical protein KDD67_13100 [Ignavibacteriae bacterium]|nr:hypothetical protein [Ignavibacteriota bacterium]MCB9214414.1 hypothetical protein [Ignavibacteria bacterium]